MSARKISPPGLSQPPAESLQTPVSPSHPTQLDLPASAVRLRKNGIEFRAEQPIPVWTEMTIAMEMSADGRRMNLTGVVVACQGTRHAGYMVSMVFTEVSQQVQDKLNSMVLSF